MNNHFGYITILMFILSSCMYAMEGKFENLLNGLDPIFESLEVNNISNAADKLNKLISSTDELLKTASLDASTKKILVLISQAESNAANNMKILARTNVSHEKTREKLVQSGRELGKAEGFLRILNNREMYSKLSQSEPSKKP